MYHFFTETEFFTESEAVITGPDVNHIKNVLRMKPGEQILLSDGKGTNCLWEIAEIENSRVLARILPEPVEDTELPVEVPCTRAFPRAIRWNSSSRNVWSWASPGSYRWKWPGQW